jgi:hypothetical protein
MTHRRPPLSVRECVIALSRVGHVADVDLDGAHFKVRWVANGKRHLLILSRSPSDWRSPANARATLRRLLRADEGEGAALHRRTAE